MVRDAVRCVGVLTRTDGRPQKPRWGEIGGGGGGRQKTSGGTRWHPQSCGMGDEVQVNGVVVVQSSHIGGRMKNEVLLNSIIVVADLHDGEAPARKVAAGTSAQRRSNRAWASRPRFRAPWMMFEAKVCSSEAQGAIIHSAAAAALSAPFSGGGRGGAFGFISGSRRDIALGWVAAAAVLRQCSQLQFMFAAPPLHRCGIYTTLRMKRLAIFELVGRLWNNETNSIQTVRSGEWMAAQVFELPFGYDRRRRRRTGGARGKVTEDYSDAIITT
ncbi:hypothetical protein B0H11DRAFT_2418512 [Mycena galericulata]|nr:hypothetical protein B0H11DRAFT_2418512 [Mycena galericulata]